MISENTKTLIRYRMSQAEESLTDAEILIQAQRTPRSIINRCYYAMFYAALALLQTTGKASSKHTGVISLFDTEFILKGVLPKQLSKDFHRAFKQRQTSDYEVAGPLDDQAVQEARREAKEFIQAVQKYLTEQGWL
jgi:uncharacterized protein (UPF0332 family)